MADSLDTQIAPAARRNPLPAAPSWPALPQRPSPGFPSPLALFRPRPCPKALAQAIERHRAAQAAVDAVIAKGYGGDLGDIPEHLCDAEFDARLDIAEQPAGTDAELLRKLRHLFDRERRAWGDNWDASDKFASVFVALEAHFDPGVMS